MDGIPEEQILSQKRVKEALQSQVSKSKLKKNLAEKK
jgi:hypothetical protein